MRIDTRNINRPERKQSLVVAVTILCLTISSFQYEHDYGNKNPSQSKESTTENRDPERIVNITALQAGSNHFKNGNPGLERNFELFAAMARKAANSEPPPDLICFPEYAISGWSYPSEMVINSIAEPVPGQGVWYKRYSTLAHEIGVPVLGWIVESDEGRLFNTSFMLDGEGEFLGKYRKVHANLGEQTWWGWSQGEQFNLIELEGVKYGISICADMILPETVRCEELMGADVILHVSIGDDMGQVIPARAFDSRLPIVVTIFRGGSYAVDSEGAILGKLSPDSSSWKTFQIHPFKRHLGKKYGGVWDYKKGQQNVRNVGAYSILTDPSTRPSWTEIFMDDKGNAQTKEQLLKRFNGRYDVNDNLKSEDPSYKSPVELLSVASVQMRSSVDMMDNAARIAGYIKRCAAAGARVAVFPESALSGIMDEKTILELTADHIYEAEQKVTEACREASVYAIVGMPWRDGTKLFNSAAVISPEGKVIERYHKIQLAGEVMFDPGDHLSVFMIDGIPCSIIICHDERYPELVRLPVLAGAKVIFYISHESGVKAESKMGPYRAQIQARAAENSVYIVHSNAPANPDASGSHGQSRIIAPDGNIITEASIYSEEVLTGILDLAKANRGNALKSLTRGPLHDWWEEGLKSVRIIQ